MYRPVKKEDYVFISAAKNISAWVIEEVDEIRNRICIYSKQDPNIKKILIYTVNGLKVEGLDTIHSICFLNKTRAELYLTTSFKDKIAPDGFVFGQGAVIVRQRRSGEDRYVSAIIHDSLYYAVFDGHGGSEVVDLLKNRFHFFLANSLMNVDMLSPTNVKKACQTAIENFEKDLLEKINVKESGSTAVFALVGDKYVYMINLGDSRGIIFNQKGEIFLKTIDHTPIRDKYRIEKEGGFVMNNRVANILAISRAFGDFRLKKPLKLVSLESDFYFMEKIPETYLLLASDGLFEALNIREPTDQEVINYLIRKNPIIGLNRLIDFSIKNGSTDDITVLIAKL